MRVRFPHHHSHSKLINTNLTVRLFCGIMGGRNKEQCPADAVTVNTKSKEE